MIPPLQKYPTEVRVATFDFIEKMDVGGGEAILTVTMDVPAGITASTPSIDGPTVSTRLSGGTAGNNYDVKCTVTTSNTQTLKLVVRLEVRDDAN